MDEIKEVFYSPYQLSVTHGKANAVSEGWIDGVLLKVQFINGWSGFSCLQTWPQLGGSTLDQSLKSLNSPFQTLEARQALMMAEFEMNWRRLERRVPNQRVANWPQHLLLHDLSKININRIEDFKTLKIKMSREWRGQLRPVKELIEAGFRLRLDFNNQCPRQEFAEFLQNLSVQEFMQIDYFEDPFSYNLTDWSEISLQSKVSLAWDFQVGEFPTQLDFVFIHKPMREQLQILPRRTFITSNMDHPVGQRLAFLKLLSYVETKMIALDLTHGLNSHLNFERSKYSEQMGNGEQFNLWSEPGVGFAELLKEEPWKKL